jgi:enoyl-CoA hydratase
MHYEHLVAERLGSVARLTLAREGASNAQNTRLLDELDDALGACVADADVRVIVLAGQGRHFSAGHDLREGGERMHYSVEQRWAHEELRYFDYCMRLWDCPKPTIAQVQGACISGGFMIANMCDLVVAGESAFFSDPVVHTLAAAATEVLIHPWVMGLRKAKELLYTGGRMDAREALAIGLVNRVVADAQLEQETLALARRVAEAPPFALRLMKRSLNRTLDAQGFRTALQAHFDTHQLSHRTSEYEAKRDAGLDAALRR